jgi:hypothetical protein
VEGQYRLDSADLQCGAVACYEYSYEHSDYIKSFQCINQMSKFSAVTLFQEGSWLGNEIQYIENHAHECHSLTDYATPLSRNLKWKRVRLFPEYI